MESELEQMMKCDMCYDRTSTGKRPMCVTVCPSGALAYGPRAEITADSQVARVFEWRRGFNTIHLIHLGVQLGLFRALAEAPGSTPPQLAATLGLHTPYVERWCMTAYGMELLDAPAEGRFRLAPFMDVVLAAPSHPRYMGGYVQLGAEVATEDFLRCLQAFKTGEAVPFQGRGDAFNHAVVSFLN